MAAAVPADAGSCADVGAGDGQLACRLAGRGLRVIATERGPGPYARLRAYAPRLDCRMGDGLHVLSPGEVDGAVVAGMGGRTITAILESSFELVCGLGWLVLQPQQHAEPLVAWLTRRGFTVESATTVDQRCHSYRVLVVRPHERS